ncbi:Golgi pH regulator [Escovopsis weberi]|uniref:Golgi pH regulator n=1 Tax=Escovopsis weberi TaxID=150374 RepID=A0A0M8MR95_ESCWE|nr:Golgi pH regulator [Escovopsis weberi]
MWPFSAPCDADSCAATTAASHPGHALAAMTPSALVASLPFAAVFAASTAIALRVVFPRLSAAASDDARDGEDHVLPRDAPAALRQAHAEHGAKSSRRRGGAWAFAATVGLAATLAALIMAEISGAADPRACNLALAVTVPGLLFMLVVLVPWLECRSLLASTGWSFQRSARGSPPRLAMLLHAALFGGWLFAFWSMGSVVPAAAFSAAVGDNGYGGDDDMLRTARAVPPSPGRRRLGEPLAEMLVRACLERVGVVGIALMALLSGFAAVSAPWHTFLDASGAAGGGGKGAGWRRGRGRRPVTEADVTRKQAGLDATSEMLVTKRHRLQALERKATAAADSAKRDRSGGGGGGGGGMALVSMVVGSLRGQTSEETEMRALRIDIAGLEAMEANLASSLSLMRTQRAASARAATPLGRLCLVPPQAFAAYCVYRILATALTTLRRASPSSPSSPSASSFSSSDPISRVLGLLARHWDPALDQLAWARIVSFALSGAMLAASAGSAVQTFHLFAKWTPGLLRSAQAVLALAVGQVAATYVVSAGLLLRSQLPGEARLAVGGVLRGALTPSFVDGWFEGWFLAGSAATALGIWVGRKLAGDDDDWDDYAMEEMGAKRS